SQSLGDPPFIAYEELRNMRAFQQSLVLNIDAEGVHLAQQQRSHTVPRARRIEGKRPRRIGRVQDIERLTPDVSAELDGMAAANHRKSVEILCDRRCKFTVRSRSWPELLIPGNGKNREHRCE